MIRMNRYVFWKMRSRDNGIYNGGYKKESGDILLSFGES